MWPLLVWAGLAVVSLLALIVVLVLEARPRRSERDVQPDVVLHGAAMEEASNEVDSPDDVSGDA
jgi:hypothetical protein